MSRALVAPINSRFFSAFHRYITLASISQRHSLCSHHTASSRPKHIDRTSNIQRHYASTSASSSTAASPPPPPQPPSEKPLFYDLFPQTLPHGPPPTGAFVIDSKKLRKEFLQLQARAHPDRHSGPDKARAEGTSALINNAYRTLLSPLKRAQYLLQLRGIDVAEDEHLKTEDPELLMEVLEVREKIEAAEEEGELEGLKRANEENVRRSEGVLEECFGRDDVKGAMEEAVRLRYWENVRESLEGWERGKPVVLVH